MMLDWFKVVKDSFEGVPIVVKGDYHYFVHPLSDGIHRIDPDLLGTVADEMVRMIPEGTDLLLTAEAMGIPLITAISERSGIPFSIVRKRRYGIEGEISLRQVTGYSQNDLYMNLPKEKKRIAIVDDVLSTGGTIRAMVGGLRSTGGDVGSILVFADKMNADSRKKFEDDIGCPIRTLVHVEVQNGRCIVRPEDG
jgi:adenine phosphoribosyltransferase